MKLPCQRDDPTFKKMVALEDKLQRLVGSAKKLEADKVDAANKIEADKEMVSKLTDCVTSGVQEKTFLLTFVREARETKVC